VAQFIAPLKGLDKSSPYKGLEDELKMEGAGNEAHPTFDFFRQFLIFSRFHP